MCRLRDLLRPAIVRRILAMPEVSMVLVVVLASEGRSTVSIKNVRPKTPRDVKEVKVIGRIMVAPETAEVVRKVAKHLGWTLDKLVQTMLMDWVPRSTNLVLETDEGEIDPLAAPGHGVLGRAQSGSDDHRPSATRRRKR